MNICFSNNATSTNTQQDQEVRSREETIFHFHLNDLSDQGKKNMEKVI